MTNNRRPGWMGAVPSPYNSPPDPETDAMSQADWQKFMQSMAIPRDMLKTDNRKLPDSYPSGLADEIEASRRIVVHLSQMTKDTDVEYVGAGRWEDSHLPEIHRVLRDHDIHRCYRCRKDLNGGMRLMLVDKKTNRAYLVLACADVDGCESREYQRSVR